MVVVVQPRVEVGLQHLDALEQLRMHRRPEELFQHGAVEALDEPIGPRRPHPSLAVLDVVERQVELVRVALGAAEFAAVVGQHRADRQP